MASVLPLRTPSMRDRVSAAEWDMRVDLAACYRLVARYGMTDLVYNHITARIPGPEHHILINAYGMLYEEITASSLIKVDLAGNVHREAGRHRLLGERGRLHHPQRGARGARRTSCA